MELQYLSTKAQRDSTLAQLEASMQSAKSSYEQLALAMENIDSHGNVIAPVDGVLASLTASEGRHGLAPATPSPSSTARSR